mgnify:CR=1 FL=1
MAENNSFTSHFVELRERLLQSLIFIFIIFIISYIFAEQIYNFLTEGDILTELFINSLDSKDKRDIAHELNRRTELKIISIQ